MHAIVNRWTAVVLALLGSIAGCRRGESQASRAEPSLPADGWPSAQEPSTTIARRARQGPLLRAVRCGNESLVVSVSSEWRQEQTNTIAMKLAAREGSDGPWVLVRCLPARRTGFAELSDFYRQFTQPNGAPLPEQASGYAGISQTAGLRTVTATARGTLVRAIEHVPITTPATAIAMRTVWIEGQRATFAFELVGAESAFENVGESFDAMVSSAHPEGQEMALLQR